MPVVSHCAARTADHDGSNCPGMLMSDTSGNPTSKNIQQLISCRNQQTIGQNRQLLNSQSIPAQNRQQMPSVSAVKASLRTAAGQGTSIWPPTTTQPSYQCPTNNAPRNAVPRAALCTHMCAPNSSSFQQLDLGLPSTHAALRPSITAQTSAGCSAAGSHARQQLPAEHPARRPTGAACTTA
jgi:hypothetical protein